MAQYVIKDQKKLRCGITTGTCAAAAAGAAAQLLLLGISSASVQVHTPKGVTVDVPVSLSLKLEDKAEYMVVKDSGDDPDVTNLAQICASVERLTEQDLLRDEVFRDKRYPNLYLDGGKGIGRVTKAGLEQQPGAAAINAVPRAMIFQAVGGACRIAGYRGRLLITIHAPKGEELAERTFNKRLGIIGGISILGTGGLVEPMSEKAIIDTIEAQIRQLQIQGEQKLLVTPGNYGQRYAEEFLHLDMEQSIKCSNYIGETLDLAAAYGMKHFLLAGNIGKLVKLAAGIMNTHSRVADGRCEIFAVHTVLCGADREMIRKIMNCITTEEILDYLETWELREAVIQSICNRMQEYLAHRAGGRMAFGVFLFSEHYGYLGQTRDAYKVLCEYQPH